ncbi:hypothetical protein EC988_000157 [Linderina pennispora]|nr:hypothetical protein EC988_000157 [Linderina pennispora]
MRTISCSILFLFANCVSGEIFFNVPQGLDPRAVQSSLLQLGITGYDPHSRANPAGLYPAAAGAKIFNDQLIRAGIPVAGVSGVASNQQVITQNAATHRNAPVLYSANNAITGAAYSQMPVGAAVQAETEADTPAAYHVAGTSDPVIANTAAATIPGAVPGAVPGGAPVVAPVVAPVAVPGGAPAVAPGGAPGAVSVVSPGRGAAPEEEEEYEEEGPPQQYQTPGKLVRQAAVPVSSLTPPAIAYAATTPEINVNLAGVYQPNVAAAALTRFAVGPMEDLAAEADALADEAPKEPKQNAKDAQAMAAKSVTIPAIPMVAAVPSLPVSALATTTTLMQIPPGVSVVTTTKPVVVATATLTATAPAAKVTVTTKVTPQHTADSTSITGKAGSKASPAKAPVTKVPAGRPAAAPKAEESEAKSEEPATAVEESASDASSEASAEGSEASAESEADSAADAEDGLANGGTTSPLRLAAAAAQTAFKPEDIDKFTFPAASLAVDLSGYSQLLGKTNHALGAGRTGSEGVAFQGSQPAGSLTKTANHSSATATSASEGEKESSGPKESKDSKGPKDLKDSKDTKDKTAESESSSKPGPNAIVGPGTPISRDSSASSLATHTGILAISAAVFALFL